MEIHRFESAWFLQTCSELTSLSVVTLGPPRYHVSVCVLVTSQRKLTGDTAHAEALIHRAGTVLGLRMLKATGNEGNGAVKAGGVPKWIR
jgi:hypothetical protein